MDEKIEKYSKNNPIISELSGKRKKRVLFVCLGNICRSPAGEGVLKSIVEEHGNPEEWIIDSAGTGGWHLGDLPDKRMRIHARERGLDLTHRCRKVCTADFDNFDLIIPMDSNNELNLKQMAPSLEASRKIIPMASFIDERFHFDHVPDPYYEGAEGFELVLDLLQNGCMNLFTIINGK